MSNYNLYQGTDHPTTVRAESGIPSQYVERGATTVAQYQLMAQQDASDQQLAQQKQISDQQNAFNQKQVADQKAQQDALQAQADAQSKRQSDYDTGRAGLLAKGTQQISDAFARFSPDYFNQYNTDYMKKATDDINYQKDLANKQLLFGLARQGLGSSQAAVDQQGLLEEDAGRATAAQTQNATDATNTLKTQVANTKQNLLGQVTSAESVAPPIAGVNDQAVNAGLDTTRQAISGVTNNAGDTIASLGGVPTVSPLTNIFTNVLGGVGSYVGGQNALGISNSYANGRNAGLGANPANQSSTVTR
jgi:hypothetical protein